MGIISLIIEIAMLYATYYIFEDCGFKNALIVNCIYGIIVSIINNGFNILAIFLGIIVMIIEVYILYWIYNKSDSFGEFFKRIIIIGLVIAGILIVISLIASSMMGSSGLFRH